MPDDKTLSAPIIFSPVWLIIGASLLVLAALWVGGIFWVTRRKKQPSVTTLKPQTVSINIPAIKQKYLGLIAEVEQSFAARQLSSRQVHQKLSLLARSFVFEVSGFKAQIMTLSDLEKGRFPTIYKVVKDYYPSEFAQLSTGSAAEACATAKEFIQSWA